MKKFLLIVLAIIISALLFLSCFMFPENEIAVKNAIEKLK